MEIDVSRVCVICQSKKVKSNCEVCLEPVCSRCVQHVDEDRFFYAPQKSDYTENHIFCPKCFDEKVSTIVTSYDDLLEKAKQVVYLPKSYRTYVPVLKSAKFKVSVENCDDRDAAILKLGFLAAQQGFNAIVKAEIKSTKVRVNGYQKTYWSGVALPAQIDNARLELEEYREEVYRRGY